MGGSILSYNAAFTSFTFIIIIGMGGVGHFSRPLVSVLLLMKKGGISEVMKASRISFIPGVNLEFLLGFYSEAAISITQIWIPTTCHQYLCTLKLNINEDKIFDFVSNPILRNNAIDFSYLWELTSYHLSKDKANRPAETSDNFDHLLHSAKQHQKFYLIKVVNYDKAILLFSYISLFLKPPFLHRISKKLKTAA
ncbi:hypothetical protein WUBG_00192 [Wuchereria bancrofti]|uniref:Uncharacterized protein n=1 Tax=Wuchereria bancrofti TaxID=6293 RepID=J9FGW4_WUCBA|nr:hypothetical protein WUBG_00192 [Wuchereria bancrofti]